MAGLRWGSIVAVPAAAARRTHQKCRACEILRCLSLALLSTCCQALKTMLSVLSLQTNGMQCILRMPQQKISMQVQDGICTLYWNSPEHKIVYKLQ